MATAKEQEVMKPTRRPWEIYDFEGQAKDYPKTIIVAPTGESVCEVSGGWPQCTLAENEANAALIVRAVNNHDALVKALNATLHAMRSYQFGNASPDLADEVELAARVALAAAQE